MAIIVAIVVAAIPAMVPTVFPTNIVAMDPPMSRARPMTWHPHHFILAIPITRAMDVIRPVAGFNFDAIRPNSGRNKNARRN
jgi:hypothetical protein